MYLCPDSLQSSFSKNRIQRSEPAYQRLWDISVPYELRSYIQHVKYMYAYYVYVHNMWDISVPYELCSYIQHVTHMYTYYVYEHIIIYICMQLPLLPAILQKRIEISL